VETFGDVSLELANYIATAEIHRPPHNFFDAALIESLADAYAAAARDGARAIVLCSEGKNFCAGADFSRRSSLGGGGAGQLYEQAVRLFAGGRGGPG
jgi:enoyl-CoA hydratase/carnithine racemase